MVLDMTEQLWLGISLVIGSVMGLAIAVIEKHGKEILTHLVIGAAGGFLGLIGYFVFLMANDENLFVLCLFNLVGSTAIIRAFLK